MLIMKEDLSTPMAQWFEVTVVDLSLFSHTASLSGSASLETSKHGEHSGSITILTVLALVILSIYSPRLHLVTYLEVQI